MREARLAKHQQAARPTLLAGPLCDQLLWQIEGKVGTPPITRGHGAWSAALAAHAFASAANRVHRGVASIGHRAAAVDLHIEALLHPNQRLP